MARLSGCARAAGLLAAFLACEPARVALAEDDALVAPRHSRAAAKKKRHRQSESGANEEVIADPELGGSSRSPGAAADEEVIADPELDGAASTSSRATSQDETIVDPESASGGAGSDDSGAAQEGWGGAADESRRGPRVGAVDDEDAHDPMANTGISRVQAIGMFGADLHHEGNLEDAYETRLRFDAEVDFRRSRSTRISVGTRIDLLWALPFSGDPDINTPASSELDDNTGNPLIAAQHSTQLKQGRFELDVLPLSGFVDKTLFDGFHLRVGEQVVSIARLDFYSPIDMLVALDLRGQPNLSPNAGKLAQPAVRLDYDLASWATLQMVYIPWFMPNLVRPNRDRYVANALGTSRQPVSPTINSLISPSYQTKANEASLRFVGPAPDFTTPQGQARLNMRGGRFEFALSAGSALEKLPSIYMTPDFESYERTALGGTLVASDLNRGWPLASVQYHRYELFGIDGSIDLAPISVAFELAFSPSRHLTAATKDGSNLPQPNPSKQIGDPTDIYGTIDPKDTKMKSLGNVLDKSIRKGVPMLQGGLHVDWIDGERFAIVLEGFFVKAMQLPYDKTRDWWGFIPKTGVYAGGVLAATYRIDPDAGRWRFDLSVVGLVGPSLMFMPQLEFRAHDALYLTAGAQIFEGPNPTYGPNMVGGAQKINIGGLFNGYDQAYVGFRYAP